MSQLSENFKKQRKNKSLSQKELSNELGISERHYRRYEMGEVDPPTSITVKLADFYGVSVDYLIGRSE